MNVYGVAREVSVLYGRPLRPLAARRSRRAGAPALRGAGRRHRGARTSARASARACSTCAIGPSPAWLRDRLEQVGRAPHQQRGRPHQLRDDGDGPALARLRPGPDARRPARSCAGRAGRDARRRSTGWSARCRRAASAWWRDARAPWPGRHHGRRLERGVGGDAHGGPGGRLLGPAVHPARGQGAGHAHRGLAPLRARRRSRRPAAGHRAHRPPAGEDRRGHARARASSTAYVAPAAAPRGRAAAGARRPRVLGAPVPAAERGASSPASASTSAEPERGAGRSTVPDLARRRDARGRPRRGGRRATTASTRSRPRSRPRAASRACARRQVRDRALREALVGAGLTEVDHLRLRRRRRRGPSSCPGAVRLANPLSEEQGVLRGSLVVPGLLAASCARTCARAGATWRVFEIGPRLRLENARARMPAEERRLGILLAGGRPAPLVGAARGRSTSSTEGPAGAAGRAASAWPRRALVAPRTRRRTASCIPGQVRGPGAAGARTAVRVRSARSTRTSSRAWELEDAPIVAELRSRAASTPGARARARPLPRFPAVERDLSVLVDAARAVRGRAGRASAAPAGPLLRTVRVVDRYDRPPVPAGQVSLTLALAFQDPARTLTGDEVQASVDAVVAGAAGAGLGHPGRVRAGMDDGFELLEEKVRKAAELVRDSRREPEPRARDAEARKRTSGWRKSCRSCGRASRTCRRRPGGGEGAGSLRAKTRSG